MKLLLASLAATSLAQVDYVDYNFQEDYDILDLLADQPEALYDYYSEDGAGLGINPRNNQASRKLPEGIKLSDFRRPDGSFNVQAFRAAVKAAREAERAAAAAAEQAAIEAAAAAAAAEAEAALAAATAQAEALAQEAAAELAAEREAAAVADELVESLNLADNDGFVAADERYFFTNPATTSTTTTTTASTLANDGTSCWKCDEMTFTNCASQGSLELCKNGDKDCCFVEVRETKQALQQLCTGCKSKNSCENLRDENFSAIPNARDQCRPNYRYQTFVRNAEFQSVCRQCFNTCSTATPERCFGGSATTTKLFFKNRLANNQDSYTWGGFYNGVAEIDSIGIPTHGTVDNTLDATVVTAISALSSTAGQSVLNVFFNNNADGKINSIAGNNARESNEMTFWSVSGASAAWWASDLKSIQDTLRNDAAVSGRTAASFN